MNEQQQPNAQPGPPPAPDPEPPAPSPQHAAKRLHRRRDQRILLGVCGGLAAYFEIDPTITRLVFLLLALFGGSGIVLYVALAIIMPGEDKLDVHPREASRATVSEAAEDTKQAVSQAVSWVWGKFRRTPPSDGEHGPSQPPGS